MDLCKKLTMKMKKYLRIIDKEKQAMKKTIRFMDKEKLQ